MTDQSIRGETLESLGGATRGFAARRELWGWGVLAIGSLAVAGIFALLLAFSRIPGVEGIFPWPLDFFEKGLVIHVIFSFVVWFLACFGALLHIATFEGADGEPRLGPFGRFAGLCVAASFFLLFVPAFMDRGEASLNNYVPVITDRIYYAGLGVLGLGLSLSVIRFLVNLRAPLSPLGFAMACGAGVFLVAMVDFGLALGLLEGYDIGEQFNEELFWAGGHVLQFLNVILLIACWYLMGAASGGTPVLGAKALKISCGLAFVTVLPTPLVLILPDDPLTFQRAFFTDLQYLLAPPTLIAAIAGLRGAIARDFSMRDLGFLCLALSPIVFGVGGFLGLFVDGADTRTPAHYHGVIAGINVALMGLFFVVILPLLNAGRPKGKVYAVQVILFAFGQTFASIGLFLAGGYGAPRKTAGAEQGLEALGAKIGLYMNGVGALIAVIGGIIFIWTMARILAKCTHVARENT